MRRRSRCDACRRSCAGRPAACRRRRHLAVYRRLRTFQHPAFRGRLRAARRPAAYGRRLATRARRRAEQTSAWPPGRSQPRTPARRRKRRRHDNDVARRFRRTDVVARCRTHPLPLPAPARPPCRPPQAARLARRTRRTVAVRLARLYVVLHVTVILQW